MSRLTYKKGKGLLVDNNIDYGTLTNVCYQNCVDKLGKLEDIEDELGIELTTLFGMLKNGFYIKDETGILFVQNVEQWEKLKQYSDFTSQYGKTWALTKEELL